MGEESLTPDEITGGAGRRSGPPAPVCPHCNADPCAIAVNVAVLPRGLALAIAYCAGCRKVLGVAPAGVVDPERSESRIVVPN